MQQQQQQLNQQQQQIPQPAFLQQQQQQQQQQQLFQPQIQQPIIQQLPQQQQLHIPNNILNNYNAYPLGMVQQPQRQQIFNNYNPYSYGVSQQGPEGYFNKNKVYDDDLPIIKKDLKQQEKEHVKTQNSYDLAEKVQFQISSITKGVKLSSNSTQTVPAVISVNSQKQDEKEGERQGVDLICIIDVSGSMGMEDKIGNVRKALLYLIELMNENDRICLITFESWAERLQGFIPLTKENKEVVKQKINTLTARGGNNLAEAVNMSVQHFRDRKEVNSISSIFLLADGQDPFPSILRSEEGKLPKGETYTIHSFGFGSDHDPVLMTDVAKAGGGSFYFVEDVKMAPEFFVDALGLLYSVVGQNVKITIKNQNQEQNKIFSDVRISKTYGEMWKYDEKNNTYSVELKQLTEGTSKEFVLELSIPPIPEKLEDYQRNPILLEGELEIESLESNSEKVNKKSHLEITFYNENEQIPEEQEKVNENVELNYVRVQGAEAFEQMQKQVMQGQYEQAQQTVDKALGQIQQASQQNQQHLEMMVNDLKKVQQSCQNNNNNSYMGYQQQQQQQQQLMYMGHAHMNQQSMPSACNNVNAYSNKCQIQMQTQLVQLQQQQY